MNASLAERLVVARAKVSELEQSLVLRRNAELAALPSSYGFEDVDSFIKALRRGGMPADSTKKGKRRRAVITDEIKANVKKLLNEGKTGGEIAKAVGVSLPTVQNLKKEFGLVKKRKN